MNAQHTFSDSRISYSVPSLSNSTGIGQTSIWAAIKSGELPSRKLVIGGVGRARRIVTRKAAMDWIESLPEIDESAA